MKRAMRRALREWKEEFNSNWAKLNTFMRMVLGIVIAMLIIWSGRRWVLDPLQGELTKAIEQNEAVDIPAGVTTTAQDPDVIELQLKEENLNKSLKKAQGDVQEAAKGDGVVSQEKEVNVLSALNSLIDENGLLLQNRAELEEDETLPMPTSHHCYTVIGTFSGMYDFLHTLDQFPYLSGFNAIELSIATDSSGLPRRMSNQSILKLNFESTLYYFQ